MTKHISFADAAKLFDMTRKQVLAAFEENNIKPVAEIKYGRGSIRQYLKADVIALRDLYLEQAEQEEVTEGIDEPDVVSLHGRLDDIEQALKDLAGTVKLMSQVNAHARLTPPVRPKDTNLYDASRGLG